MRATKSSLRAVKCITKRKKVTNQNQKYCLMQDVFIRWKLHIILSLDDRSCPRYSRRYKYNELNKWFRSRIQPSVLYFLKAINMCYKYNAKSEIYGLGLTTSNPPPPLNSCTHNFQNTRTLQTLVESILSPEGIEHIALFEPKCSQSTLANLIVFLSKPINAFSLVTKL